MCGLPPFVDEMIDVFIDDEMVYVGVPRLFTKPLRLTAPEGFALLTAGRAAMQLPGADPAEPARSGPGQARRGARRDGTTRRSWSSWRRPRSSTSSSTPPSGSSGCGCATGRRRATR